MPGFVITCVEALPVHLHDQPIACDHKGMIQRL